MRKIITILAGLSLSLSLFQDGKTKKDDINIIYIKNEMIKAADNGIDINVSKANDNTSTIMTIKEEDLQKFTHYQSGIASYYSKGLDGSKTASGERHHMTEMVAAHKTLPFGTRVKVTNLSNGKEVIVKINDRGPFVKGRVIDLSYGAFSQIESPGKGITKVKLEILNASNQLVNKRAFAKFQKLKLDRNGRWKNSVKW